MRTILKQVGRESYDVKGLDNAVFATQKRTTLFIKLLFIKVITKIPFLILKTYHQIYHYISIYVNALIPHLLLPLCPCGVYEPEHLLSLYLLFMSAISISLLILTILLNFGLPCSLCQPLFSLSMSVPCPSQSTANYLHPHVFLHSGFFSYSPLPYIPSFFPFHFGYFLNTTSFGLKVLNEINENKKMFVERYALNSL